MTQLTQYKIITAGPSKLDLMFAFFDKPDVKKFGGRRSLSFTIQNPNRLINPMTVEIVINSLEWEDGSGESWNFKGRCLNEGGHECSHLKGYFKTTDRQGWLEIEVSKK
jgi:hypothetical protein